MNMSIYQILFIQHINKRELTKSVACEYVVNDAIGREFKPVATDSFGI